MFGKLLSCFLVMGVFCTVLVKSVYSERIIVFSSTGGNGSVGDLEAPYGDSATPFDSGDPDAVSLIGDWDTDGEWDGEYRAILEFSLSALPENVEIKCAVLGVFMPTDLRTSQVVKAHTSNTLAYHLISGNDGVAELGDFSADADFIGTIIPATSFPSNSSFSIDVTEAVRNDYLRVEDYSSFRIQYDGKRLKLRLHRNEAS